MQENKNLILAIVLCLAILIGWQFLSDYMGWTPKKPAPEAQAPQTPAPAPADIQPLPQSPVFKPSPGRDITINTPLYKAELYSGGGTLRSFYLKKYKVGITANSPLINLVNDQAAAQGPLGLVINSQPSWSTGQWAIDTDQSHLTVKEGEKAAITLVGDVDGLKVTRRLEFPSDNYVISEKIHIDNISSNARSIRLAYTTAMDKGISSGGQYDTIRIAWDENGSLEEEDSSSKLENGIQATGQIYWAGPMTSYFLSAVLPEQTANVTIKGLIASNVYRVALQEEEFILLPGQGRDLSSTYWLGPKIRSEMAAVSDQLIKSIYLGFFGFIGKCLIWLLEFFNTYAHNWGISIIILTLVLKIILWPLSEKQFASMEKMKQLSPIMKQLQEKYKNNREMLNKEMMNLYRTYGVNPAGGCLPILAQMPIFFGLYQALLNSIALRHASFITYLPGTDIIWLADLSAKDPLYITPILMGITMFIQQRLSPPPADPMQAKIMMFLPLIFTLLFLNFPAGLVIYWLCNNILTILQQWLLMRKMKNKKAEPLKPVKKTAK